MAASSVPPARAPDPGGEAHPDFHHFLRDQQAVGVFRPPTKALTSGDTTDPIRLAADQAQELLGVAARQAAGFFRPTKRTEIVWVRGAAQLAVGIVGLRLETSSGFVTITLPVRCDQTGPDKVRVTFAVGSADEPAGLFASTYRRPVGPEPIVAAWGENLVAFAWQCLLGLTTGLSGAIGKDTRGNLLVPVELVADSDGLQLTAMARFRFSGSAGLNTAIRR